MGWNLAGNIKGPAGDPEGAIDNGLTPLVVGLDYIDVTFNRAQSDLSWAIRALNVLNTSDPSPAKIAACTLVQKTTLGFRVTLSGAPDTGNYLLQWGIIGTPPPPPTPATTYVLSGPLGGGVGVPSGPFTVHLLPGNTVAAPVTITPHATAGARTVGTFSPASVALTTASPTATFTFTPSTADIMTISTTNDGGLTDPTPINYTAAAGTYSVTGPSGGVNHVPSTNFTVALSGGSSLAGATMTVLLFDGGAGGTFTPASVGLTDAAPSATFTYTPAGTGAKNIVTTNDKGFTVPAAITYTVTGGALIDGDSVTRWPDASPNGRDATAVGTVIYKTVGGPNGKPFLRFSAANASGLNFTPPISGNGPFEMYAVMKRAAAGSIIRALASSTNVNGAYGINVDGTYSPPSGLIAIATKSLIAYATPIPFPVGWHMIRMNNDNSSAGFEYDGTPAGLTTYAAATTGDLDRIGYSPLQTTGLYSDADIAELIVFLGTVSDIDRTNLTHWISDKYGFGYEAGVATPPNLITSAALTAWWKADAPPT